MKLVTLLTSQDGVGIDREFAAFLDFGTFAPPEPPVYIGMTEYENLGVFARLAETLGSVPEAAAFGETFVPEVFTVLRPLDPSDRYDLATIANEPGQALEIAARDLSQYDNFDADEYEARRDAFLAGLAEQDGFVAEYQWVSVFDPNLVVGMTVYESAEAFQTIATSEFAASAVSAEFGGAYPTIAGFVSFDAKQTVDGASNEEVDSAEPLAYDGIVTELAIRRLNEGQDLDAFATSRDELVDLLTAQDGVGTDREFAAFLDFGTFAPPEPPVYIGMTEYDNLDVFIGLAGTLGSAPEAAAFGETFTPEVFTALRPLAPTDRYDLATIANESGQALEVAVRDLSQYENFDATDYEAKLDAFLAALAEQDGFVAEYQWVSVLDPNIVVGMTVYESAETFQMIATSEFAASAVSAEFGTAYPTIAGFVSFDAKQATSESSAIELPGVALYPEGIAVDGESVYAAGFLSGEIVKVDLATGESTQLVAAGTDGVIAGWGLAWDENAGQLLACGNKNGFGQPPTEPNSVRAIDPNSGEIVQTWELPAGVVCNALMLDNANNIYLSNVGLAANVIKIDRVSDEVSVWSADERWPNESGFGLSGVVFDRSDNLYVHYTGGVFRVPINADGSAGEAVMQSLVDGEGNPVVLPGVDGLAWAGSDTLLTTNADLTTGASEIVQLTIVDEDVLRAETVFTELTYGASIAIDAGTAYVTDAQLFSLLAPESSGPALPFTVKVFAVPHQ